MTDRLAPRHLATDRTNPGAHRLATRASAPEGVKKKKKKIQEKHTRRTRRLSRQAIAEDSARSHLTLVDPRQQSVQSEAGPLGCVVSPPERAKGHSGPPLGRVREGREASVKLTCPGEELFAPLERKQPPPPTRSDLQSSRMGESNQSRSERSLTRSTHRPVWPVCAVQVSVKNRNR